MASPSDDSPAHAPSDWLAAWQEHGDREALGRLLAAEVEALKARLRKRWNPSITPDFGVSDAAQEAVGRLLGQEQPLTFETPQALRAYLWKAARRLLEEHLRRRRSVGLDDVSATGLDGALAISGGHGSVERRDRADALEVVVNLLEPEEQQILELAITRGLGVEGAARELGIPLDRARNRHERARRQLEVKLRHWSELIG
jgi:RNA polymerase sigma factor (sigma-70 family)